MLQEPRRVPPSADGGRESNRVFRRHVRRKTHFSGHKCASESECAQRPAAHLKNACIFEMRVEVFRHAEVEPHLRLYLFCIYSVEQEARCVMEKTMKKPRRSGGRENNILLLTGPIFVELLLQMLVGNADQIMVGWVDRKSVV